MSFKKILSILFINISFSAAFAAEPTGNYKLYGFVRNDFYINSRQNIEALDGLFNIFPKPVDLNQSSEDKNAVPNAEMLSIATRLGLDFTGTTLFGGKASAKIECDFAGISTSYYLIRLRQAYMKLNWENTELLVGQTWHPLFGNVMPTVPSLNTGSPFQPFNRSPQIRLKQALDGNFSLIAAATYQMQYMSQGPNGTSASYLKNALLPNLYVGFENKSNKWTTGIGFDAKTLKINHEKLNSTSVVAYTQFVQKAIQMKAKVVYGQNLSDHLMIGGYGVSGTNSTTNEPAYSNLNTLSSWLNVVYGSKLQVGIFAGISQNLGAHLELKMGSTGKYTVYGYGFYPEIQQLVDRLFRIAPHVSYNLSNFKLAAEYELTSAQYGNIQSNGRISNPYSVNNHRVMATISYLF